MTLQDRVEALEAAVKRLDARRTAQENEFVRLEHKRQLIDREAMQRDNYIDKRTRRLEERLREAADAITKLAQALQGAILIVRNSEK